MTATLVSIRSGVSRAFGALLLSGAVALAAVFPVGDAFAAPVAGTPIGNQASASYLDASGTSRTATSNSVTTIVTQVASLTLTASGSVVVAPGGQASFPHVLTNTGNGVDNFSLAIAALVGDDFNLTGATVYADADGNGLPDNFTPLASTGALNPNQVFRFVLVGNVPGAQVAGEVAQTRITATSGFDALQTAFNTDVVTVTGNAVVNVTKAISQNAGPSPSGPWTYTLTYTNAGNATATQLVLRDALPAGMTYVAGSARWSVTGATVLTDADSSDTHGVGVNNIKYDFGVSTAGSVRAVVNQIPAGASGTVTFQVNVNPGLAPQTLNNAATYTYADPFTTLGPFSTNVAPFTVNQSTSLTFTGQTIAAANQGSTLIYTNTLTNTGNGSDVFEITLTNNTFPAGSSVVLFRSDGVTPLTNSNGIPTADTGPLAAGASTTIVLQVTLPPSATGGPFSIDKLAASATTPGVTATATDVLTSINAAAVDLTNNAPGGPGAGAGPEGAPVVLNATNPGTTTRFTLFVANTGATADAYDMTISTDASFAAITLPAGWSVTFRNAGNAVITNTGSIAPGGNVQVFADVSVPAGYAAGTVSLYFRSRSPVSLATDRIHDAVSVNPLRSLALVPNNALQVAPGGTVTYSHLLSNTGNVIEGDGVGSFVALTVGDDQAAWTSVLYVDSNNNGAFDSGIDQPIGDLTTLGGLAPGANVRLFVRVFAPAGAPVGQVNLTTVTAATTNLGYPSAAPPPTVATDQTTVLNGQIQISKRQATDGNCDGTPEVAFTLANLSAAPGGCLRYEIVVTNVGTASITNLVVADATPPNTTYSAAIPGSTTQGTLSTPANGAAGTINANIGTLAPGGSVTIVFGIRIDP
ncbi:MAG: DUF11 domain-containing protein [Candidatus Eisenbacteria bacterium]|uniref:DUF11 domain-containing protein n=1 Tax=Eiseniibacteriota bacterium TaxID=2212470 RepID=A0A849SJA1_UNCEI|nr:DUF11 domain-containing protein [Candidatus Eisenbacteria bacterium]